jgi:acetolactate synthase-1/3 small subunit
LGEKMTNREKVFVTWVQDRPGVLTRIASAFFRRGINIINLTVGSTHIEGVSKMVIRTSGDNKELDQLSRYIDREVDVLEVQLQDPEIDTVAELCFVRVGATNDDEREEILDATHAYRPEVERIEHDSIVLRTLSTPATIDHFLRKLESFDLRDVSRTGVTTMPARSTPIDE